MQKKSNSTEKTNGNLLVLAGAILWGSNGTAQAMGAPEAQPLVLGVLRILIGGLILSLPARIYLKSFPTFQPFSSIFAAAISAVIYQITFFSAIKLTGVSVGTIVGIGSSPIFAGIVAWLIRGEKPGMRWYFATLAGSIHEKHFPETQRHGGSHRRNFPAGRSPHAPPSVYIQPVLDKTS